MVKKPNAHLTTSDAIGAGIREMQIEQTLAGLELIPQMLPQCEDMAKRGDETMIEVLKRYNAKKMINSFFAACFSFMGIGIALVILGLIKGIIYQDLKQQMIAVGAVFALFAFGLLIVFFFFGISYEIATQHLITHPLRNL